MRILSFDPQIETAEIVLLLSWLSSVLARSVSLYLQVRQSAGLLLKNNLKAQYAATAEEFRQYIKVCHCLMLLPKLQLSRGPYGQARTMPRWPCCHLADLTSRADALVV